MWYQLGLRVALSSLFLLYPVIASEAPEVLQVGARLSLGSYESEIAGKIYLVLPELVRNPGVLYSTKSLQYHRFGLWIDTGRLNLQYGLYREYFGCVARFLPKQDWGIGVYWYYDTVEQERELVKRNAYYGAKLSSATLGLGSEMLCLLPMGKVINLGLEGFSPYLNASLNVYGSYFDQAMSYQFYTAGMSQNEGLLTIDSQSLMLESQWAVDANIWRRFSNTLVRSGAFYRWFDVYPNAIAQRIQSKQLDNYGGCIELEYFLRPVVKAVVKGSWDNWNKYRLSGSLTFESSPKTLPLYQPTRRHVMPLQYDLYKRSIRSEYIKQMYAAFANLRGAMANSEDCDSSTSIAGSVSQKPSESVTSQAKIEYHPGGGTRRDSSRRLKGV